MRTLLTVAVLMLGTLCLGACGKHVCRSGTLLLDVTWPADSIASLSVRVAVAGGGETTNPVSLPAGKTHGEVEIDFSKYPAGAMVTVEVTGVLANGNASAFFATETSALTAGCAAIPVSLTAADLAPSADLATKRDALATNDLSTDLATDDLTASTDLSSTDLSIVTTTMDMMDMTSPIDMTSLIDMTPGSDMTKLGDLVTLPDLITPACPTVTTVAREDFRGTTYNTSKWEVKLNALTQAGMTDSATVENHELKLVNRPHFNTIAAYPPSATAPVRVTFEWHTGRPGQTDSDNMQVSTRSSGTPDASFGETTEGIECEIQTSGSGGLVLQGKGPATVTGGVLNASIDEGADDVYLIDMFDDGTNVSCNVTNRRTGNVFTVSGTSSFVGSTNKVSFNNREYAGGFDQISYLDNITVEQGVLTRPGNQWGFDEKTATTAVQPSAGTVSGTLGSDVQRIAGLVGQSAALEGVTANSYVIFPTPTGQYGTGDYTLSYWINIPTQPTGSVELLNTRADDTCTTSIGARLSTGKIEFDSYNGTSCAAATANTFVIANSWAHLLFVRAGATYTIYVDGMFAGSGTQTTGFNENDAQALIFGRSNSTLSTERYEGLVDDLRLYPRAVSACEAHVLGAL